MVWIAALLAVLSLALFWLASRRQRTLGLPGGQVIYSDTRAWGKVEAPLYAASLGLTGKPDYLLRQGEKIIPVEVKSARGGQTPLDSHIYQLASYCLLVEHAYHRRPEYGILHYPGRSYRIDFTAQLEADTLRLLDEMREQDRRRECPRSHQSARRCRSCGFRAICDQRL
ncbi:MAG: CRISPR-associated protein Cas4 [Chloroflexi bacterium]|nr:CRISPR-associated protein Cas4 [Chloroflexota bacterium]